jgi:hypothetical protein
MLHTHKLAKRTNMQLFVIMHYAIFYTKIICCTFWAQHEQTSERKDSTTLFVASSASFLFVLSQKSIKKNISSSKILSQKISVHDLGLAIAIERESYKWQHLNHSQKMASLSFAHTKCHWIKNIHVHVQQQQWSNSTQETEMNSIKNNIREL